ncbi:NADase-type glycan-binding domain-containing protein [Streptomyces massasporeus]|uniref:NADase-type glycan-binding domain-containing protein n=1 Tax=Streptomyces massasporeus TaxID=67324 RepID=UPI0036798869
MTTPQNCADCGTRAQPGQSFCDACGSVLSWTDGAARTAGNTGPDGAARGSGSGSPADAAGGSSGSAGTTPSPTAAPATPAAPAPASASASASGAPSSADPHPGWDAFSRPDGGAGLPPTSRDRTGPGATAHTTASRTTAPPVSGTPDEAPVRAAQGPEPGTASAQPADHHPGSADGTPHPHTASHPAADDTAPTQPVPPAAPAPDPSTTQGINTRARRLLVPVTDAEPRPAAEPSVAPVLPGRPAPQRPEAVRAPGEEHGIDGGTACPWCATRNRPERHFCARCAMPMAGDGPAPVQLPWWRRLGPFGSRETPWAGDRPRLRRTFDRVLSWLGIAIVLALLIALVVNIPQGIQATRDHFAKRAPVSPDRYSASRSYPGHKPDLVFDKLNDTWWGPGVSESAQGQYIEARFDEPTRLLDLIITPGTSTRADQLSKSALPHRLTATVTGKDGRTTTRSLTLDQGAGPQRRAFRVGEVTAVRFTIDSAYGTSAKKQVAIAEIEFFGPSSANNT